VEPAVVLLISVAVLVAKSAGVVVDVGKVDCVAERVAVTTDTVTEVGVTVVERLEVELVINCVTVEVAVDSVDDILTVGVPVVVFVASGVVTVVVVVFVTG